MSDYLERMEEELKQLQDKLFKLTSFIGSNDFLKLSNESKSLLTMQHNYMSLYMSVLTKRINLETK